MRPVGRILVFAIAVLVLSAGSARAQFDPASSPFSRWSAMLPAAQQVPHPAVVRVIAAERDGASLGSGSLVHVGDKYGLVITNWHVVRDVTSGVIVVFPDGFQSPGTILKVDRHWDLAAIAIWKPRVVPMSLATEAPKPGELLTIAGYGSGNYRAQSGRCSQYLAPARNLPYEMVEVEASARQGDSGGPILNSRGELAGVLFGEASGRTTGSHCGRVTSFLHSIGSVRPATELPMSQEQIAMTPIAGTRTPHVGHPARTTGWRAREPVVPSTSASPPVLASIAARPAAETTRSASVRPTTEMDTAAEPPETDQEHPATTEPQWEEPAGRIAHQAAIPALPEQSSSRAENDSIPTPVMNGPISEPPQPPRHSVESDQLSWEDIAGRTLGEQVKTVLAGIGLLAILLLALRRVTHAA